MGEHGDKLIGGGGGIRTHEGLRPAGFQDRSHQPLDHPSEGTADDILPSAARGARPVLAHTSILKVTLDGLTRDFIAGAR
jgi:hypothetical protein